MGVEVLESKLASFFKVKFKIVSFLSTLITDISTIVYITIYSFNLFFCVLFLPGEYIYDVNTIFLCANWLYVSYYRDLLNLIVDLHLKVVFK